MVNTSQINTTSINAHSSGYIDCSTTMVAVSGGVCSEIRVVSQSVYFHTQSLGTADNVSLTLSALATFPCVCTLKVKLVIPVYLTTDAVCTGDMLGTATEIFDMSATFPTESSLLVSKSATLRKGNPGVVFNKYSLQYINAGRIIIYKNKYL